MNNQKVYKEEVEEIGLRTDLKICAKYTKLKGPKTGNV
jgi:hypothetical protein